MAEAVVLSALRPGVRLRGVLPNQIVTLASVFAISDGVVEVSYRDEDGRLAERILTEVDAARLEVVGDAEAGPAFDGDPDEFKLVAEALHRWRADCGKQRVSARFGSTSLPNW